MTLILKQAACEIGCAECTMACAILPSRIAWWEEEIAAASAARDTRRIGMAMAAHAALYQRFAESPRATHSNARDASARARLN